MLITSSTPKFNPGEIVAAASDAIKLNLGVNVQHPHPLASELGMASVAYALGYQQRVPQEWEIDRAVMARGMATADFSRILADGISGVAFHSYSEASEHKRFAKSIELRDFRPTGWPGVGTDLELELAGEGGEITYGYARLVAGSVLLKLSTYARAICVSRQAIMNDQFGAIKQVFSDIGASAARVEARLVAEALENPAVLDDGNPVFDAGYKNVVASALNDASLAVGMSYLRMQLTPSGHPAGLRAEHLIVAADLEFQALRLVQDTGVNIRVTVLTGLPEGRWYLTSNPEAHPTIVTTRLQGTNSAVRVEGAKRPFGFDGTAVRVIADLGAAVVRRDGIIRGGL
ncbi:hypothetical protein WIT60_05725 [Aquabacterium sp. G14]|uniref:phage major capsid protein n=1 Tax=Aquabacterium sp. G14 TaxID=3130164 RepID=UPI0030B67F24